MARHIDPVRFRKEKIGGASRSTNTQPAMSDTTAAAKEAAQERTAER